MPVLYQQGENTMQMKLKNCEHCQGDLVLDGDEWHCLQCGRYYYPKTQFLAQHDALYGSKRRTRAGMVDQDINSLVQARSWSNERWLSRNHQVITYLTNGLSVKEIAGLTGSTPRAIREVRQRWREPVLA